MTRSLARRLTRDGIHFNTQQGRRWINDVFQTQIREMEQKLRTTNSLARTSSTGGARMRGNVPESLANRIGPLAMETGAAAPVAPSSDVRERLGTAPLPRRQPLGYRLIRIRLPPGPCLGRVTRPLRQFLKQTNRRAPCRRKELSQAACCFATVQTPAVGDSIRRISQRV